MKFTARESKILTSIQDKQVAVEEIARINNVSKRTVKSDIISLNNKIAEYDSKIILESGILRFKTIYSSVHWKNIVRLNLSIEEVDLILLKLLFKTDYIAMSDFATELYMSKSKLEKLIVTNPTLNENIIKKRNVGIAIEANSEKKLLLAISTLIKYVDDLNYLVTARVLVQQIGDFEITIEKFNQSVSKFDGFVSSHPKITDKECKILILVLLITEHILKLEESSINKFINNFINPNQINDKISFIIENEIREILALNNITKVDPSTLSKMVSHIENSSAKKYPNTIGEEMEHRLKQEYSYAYSIASELYNRLNITLGINLAKYEENYLTLYIQSLITQNKQYQNLNILIVCQYGVSVSHHIQRWIEVNVELPLNFKISSVLNFWSIKETTRNFDLIVTTIDNLEVGSTTVIKVDTVPLTSQLQTIKHKIMNTHFQKQMNNFFNNNILKQINAQTIEEIYPIIDKDLAQVNSEFLEAMKKRTDEGLTNVNNIIIMHSDGSLITENRLLIYKLNTPLNYMNEEVKMIFVFAFTVKFIEEFNSVIKQIYRIIYSEQYVKALYETTTDTQFMWIFKNQIKSNRNK